ncbi:MAG: ABC transporter permease [Rubripirellula sp.]|nr:ABC transporter permease [Rubripirellula sp.]
MKKFAYELFLLGLIGVVFAIAAILDPRFLSKNVQLELSSEIWELGLLTLGMTLVIITAGIDLSVGSAMGLCSVSLGLCMHANLPTWLCALACLVTGLTAGALNGSLVAFMKVHPLLVTLATYGMYRGFAEGLQSATTNAPVDASEGIKSLAAGTFPLVPLLFAALTVWTAILLGRTAAGRGLYAIGHNEEAARFSGIPIAKLKFWIYTYTGLLAGLAAISYSARRSATAEAGMVIELDVISAVVIGGTSIEGGRGRIAGTLLGVLLIHETRQFVDWYWQRSELTLIVIGTLLILAVLGHRFLFAQNPKTR